MVHYVLHHEERYEVNGYWYSSVHKGDTWKLFGSEDDFNFATTGISLQYNGEEIIFRL